MKPIQIECFRSIWELTEKKQIVTACNFVEPKVSESTMLMRKLSLEETTKVLIRNPTEKLLEKVNLRSWLPGRLC